MGWMPEKAREMFDKLVDMALRLGRDPSFKEVEQDPTMPHPNDFAYYFGSFSEALKQAHRAAFVDKKHDSQLPEGKIFSDEEVIAMSRKPITDEEYVAGLIRLKKELGHFPTITEVRKDYRCPSVSSYERRFGTDWYGVKAAIIRKAEDLGINEDNVDEFAPPEKPAKSEPVPSSSANSASEASSESAENPLADIPTPDFTKYNPDADVSDGDVAEGILGPDDSELGLSAEPPALTEVEPEGNKLISLLPQVSIVSPKVEGYATVFVTKGLIPLQKTVVGVPVLRNYCGLNLILGSRTVPLPEPSKNVFYIVERKIASIAKAAGRETYDLLIPEKYDRDENGMTITEFSIL